MGSGGDGVRGFVCLVQFSFESLHGDIHLFLLVIVMPLVLPHYVELVE